MLTKLSIFNQVKFFSSYSPLIQIIFCVVQPNTNMKCVSFSDQRKYIIHFVILIVFERCRRKGIVRNSGLNKQVRSQETFHPAWIRTSRHRFTFQSKNTACHLILSMICIHLSPKRTKRDVHVKVRRFLMTKVQILSGMPTISIPQIAEVKSVHNKMMGQTLTI